MWKSRVPLNFCLRLAFFRNKMRDTSKKHICFHKNVSFLCQSQIQMQSKLFIMMSVNTANLLVQI